MLDNFSNQLNLIIENALEEVKKLDFPCLTSEYLLINMFKNENSICFFLLSEYDVNLDELYNCIKKNIVIRKKENETFFSNELINTFIEAKLLAQKEKLEKINEECVLLSMIKRDNLASKLIQDLNIDIDDLIKEIKELFEFDDSTSESSNSSSNKLKYTKNITEMIKNNDIHPFVNIGDYIDKMVVTLARKSKNNPLLIGKAGVGKTSIVEGLADYFYKENAEIEILSLELGVLLSGSKYRGDFEERLLNIIDEVEKNPKYILFIDEIHNIIGSGSSEGSLDAANILKPALARGKIKCIGATTLEEYKKYIETDKALKRRFQTIFVSEPTKEETITIIQGIKNYYQDFHQVSINEDIVNYLVSESKRRIYDKVFPDKAIDVLDETMAKNKILNKKTIDFKDIDETIDKICGITKSNNSKLKIPQLKKYHLYQKIQIFPNNHLLCLNFIGNNLGLEKTINDLKNDFQIIDEAILELELSNYQEPHMLSTLIGSPPGYIGFEDGGLLTNHISNYPNGLIVLKNFSKANFKIQNFLKEIIKNGEFFDAKGKKITTKALIFLIFGEKNKKNLGFNSKNKESNFYDEEITLFLESNKNYFEEIKDLLKNKGINYNLDETDPFFEEKVYDMIIAKNKSR